MEMITAHDVRVRVQIQYIEMPGLHLSQTQIARLCDVPDDLCGDALKTLVWSGFLAETPDGSFVRSGVRPYCREA